MSSAVCAPAVGEVETAQERAQRRVGELGRAVSGVLEVLGVIYRDEDWRYLCDRNGVSYSDFGTFVRDQLGGSASNARRYRQGVEMLVAPLQELAGPDTRVPVTPHDVARLGQQGARQVLDGAAERLGEVSGAGERTAVLRELIDAAIAERRDCAGRVIDEDDVLPPLPPAQIPAAADDQDVSTEVDERPVSVPGGDLLGDGDVAGLDARQLYAALEVVGGIDPAAAARDLGTGGVISAGLCVQAAQRLARLGQILAATE